MTDLRDKIAACIPDYGQHTDERFAEKTADAILALPELADLEQAYPDLKEKADALDSMLKMAVLWLDVDGRYDIQGMEKALAEYRKATK